jgi:hypothetical protein
MPDQEIEQRLRTMLAGRAVRIEPLLSGPELRARAGTDGHRRLARIAGPVLAAAAVAVVAIVPELVGHHGGRPRPAPPAGVPTVQTTPHPTQGSTRPRPAMPHPSSTPTRTTSGSTLDVSVPGTAPAVSVPTRSVPGAVAGSTPQGSTSLATTGPGQG